MSYLDTSVQGVEVEWKPLREDVYIEIATTIEKITKLRADIDLIIKEIEL